MKLILTFALLSATLTQPSRDISILGRDDQTPNGRVFMPHVAPIIYVRQVSGIALPETGSVSCHWKTEKENGVPKVIGDCEGDVKVVVTGIDLNY